MTATDHKIAFPVSVPSDFVCSACRTLRDQGKTGSVSFTDPETGMVRITVRSLEFMATRSIRESFARGPHMVKWAPNPWAGKGERDE